MKLNFISRKKEGGRRERFVYDRQVVKYRIYTIVACKKDRSVVSNDRETLSSSPFEKYLSRGCRLPVTLKRNYPYWPIETNVTSFDKTFNYFLLQVGILQRGHSLHTGTPCYLARLQPASDQGPNYVALRRLVWRQMDFLFRGAIVAPECFYMRVNSRSLRGHLACRFFCDTGVGI